MEENQNEELQTRREFFKKAAKTALPIMAAIAVPAIFTACGKKTEPVTSISVECTGNSCALSCKNTCEDACTNSCTGSCQTGCVGSCSRTCYDGCFGTCDNICYGSCKNTCNYLCKGTSKR